MKGQLSVAEPHPRQVYPGFSLVRRIVADPEPVPMEDHARVAAVPAGGQLEHGDQRFSGH